MTARDKLIKEKRKADPELNPPTHRKWWTPISSLLHRSNTLHDESEDGSDPSPSPKKSKNLRVQPHMIRRVDEKPKPINPSGWLSQGRMPIAQAGLVESESIRSKSSITGQQPTNSAQAPEPTHSHSSGQRSNDFDVESESDLENPSKIPRRGGVTRRVSDLGEFPHRKPIIRLGTTSCS